MFRWKIVFWTLSATLITSVVTAALFHWQGLAEGNGARATQEVLVHQDDLQLTQHNLVDLLAAIPLHNRLSRVNLEQGVLDIDLKISDASVGAAVIYEDIAELGLFAMERTTNLKQLRIRIIAEDRWLGTSPLLLAADLRRGEFSVSTAERLMSAGNKGLEENLKQEIRLMETGLYRRNFTTPKDPS
ncbi:hypothetical protein DCC85_12825 [Paenibacillus sp. CAA11]|uniref:hypothetical protein n=1 Tax=Paenibacillus sp. CAA11 TaxID=1532905 RepID=UPI000D387845|nr:hypothetical protein [Paenibacillus sp. CAA11]AWB45017.1 hypothetical protein DCC85_12825 [Paenibacillus sp. CAA11]